jgi:hypothetical protein
MIAKRPLFFINSHRISFVIQALDLSQQVLLGLSGLFAFISIPALRY